MPERIAVEVLLGVEPTRLRQLNRHTGDGPSDLIGDCFRTTIACLLGLDDPSLVPHFCEDTIRAGLDQHGGWEDIAAARRWLRNAEGVDLVPLDRDEAERIGCAYQITARSKAGPWNHAVVARHGEVVWCPTTGDPETGHPGTYTMADCFAGEPVLALCLPYDPDPDEQLAIWRSQEATDA